MLIRNSECSRDNKADGGTEFVLKLKVGSRAQIPKNGKGNCVICWSIF